MVQFGVNSNKATTVHKLQGVSLNRMVIRLWSCKFPKRIYVALSRVRTLSGLFICEKLNKNKNLMWIQIFLRKKRGFKLLRRN